MIRIDSLRPCENSHGIIGEKMKTAFIIHGAYGNSRENWFPWMKRELRKKGYEVIAPDFPTPENQTLENWMKIFGKYKGKINEETIVIGHSVGVTFLLSVIEKLDLKISGAYFVAGFASQLGGKFDELNRTFVEKRFDWQKIRKNCGKFAIFASDDDPYVPMEKADELAGKLGAKVIAVKGAGHFNEKAGYTKFELLLEKI